MIALSDLIGVTAMVMVVAFWAAFLHIQLDRQEKRIAKLEQEAAVCRGSARAV